MLLLCPFIEEGNLCIWILGVLAQHTPGYNWVHYKHTTWHFGQLPIILLVSLWHPIMFFRACSKPFTYSQSLMQNTFFMLTYEEKHRLTEPTLNLSLSESCPNFQTWQRPISISPWQLQTDYPIYWILPTFHLNLMYSTYFYFTGI